MPRRGDEANRLGNEYEGLWIADSLLDVLAGDATSITVAGFGEEGKGVDLIKDIKDGTREFHSLKRQTTSPTWKLKELADRNVFDELLGKLRIGENYKAVFVSGTTPNDLNELCERASRSHTLDAFKKTLNESPTLKAEFEDHFLPLCQQDWSAALSDLRRLRVGGITSTELNRRINQTVRFLIQRKDGKTWLPLEVRLLLTHLVLDWLGQPIVKSVILGYLQQYGYTENLFIRNKTVSDRISALNANYLSEVEAELINGHQIKRNEAQAAFEILTTGQKSITAIVGAAGLGKSCVFAQTLQLLDKEKVPFIVTRLDVQTRARTSQQLGEDLSLPESPCLVLAAIAQGSPCVLALDQLDALSMVSGRNPHLWAAFGELLREATNYPNIRILVACRAFDAEHDQRLRRMLEDEKCSQKISLNQLSAEQVKEAIASAGVKSETLEARQLEILQTPQNLNLYLQSKPQENASFRDVKELFDRYWSAKQNQVGRETRFTEVIRKLSGWLSKHQTLAAPQDVLDELHNDARMMASAHVIALSDGNWRFFHETFFDYAFARTFVADGGRLIDLLISSGQEQHLFRRAQVRQILTYQRDREFGSYLKEIEGLLSESKVRFHIKKLALDWLRDLAKPTVAEWRLLWRFSDDPHLGPRIKTVPHNSPGWFDVLKEDGVWKKWLDSKDKNDVRHAIWLLSLPELNKHRSANVADLISPHLDGSLEWRNHFADLIRVGMPHRSRKMFDLFMQAYRESYFDEAHEHWWYFLVHVAEEAPDMAIEFLSVFLERWSVHIISNEENERLNGCKIPDQFIQTLEKENYLKLVTVLFPSLVSIVQKNAKIHDDGVTRDAIWSWRSYGEEHGVADSLLGAIRRGMEKMAVEAPEELDCLSQSTEELPHTTIAFLLLSAWAANPSRYTEKIAAYLSREKARLNVGYSSWGGGGGHGAGYVSRAAIRSAAPLCNEESYIKLEREILQFEEHGERSRRKGRGFKRLLLLGALLIERRSRRAQAQFEELSRRFPSVKEEPLAEIEVRSIGAPIESDAREKMNDEQWIRAMQKYSRKRSSETYEDWRKGGCDELADALRTDTANSKSRFASIALKMPANLPSVFFGRLLSGLVETEPASDGAKDSIEANRLLDTETMVAVLRRIHELPEQPCGRDISWAVKKLADRPLPDDILAMVAHYAIHDIDPSEEMWRTPASGGIPYYGGDPEFAGLNCNRGAAAQTLAKLLFADKQRWSKLQNPIQTVSQDRSLAVRAMAIECLTAALNIDKNWAVDGFLKLAVGSEEILGGHNADWFLHYATRSHHKELRPLLMQMLISPHEKVKKVAATHISVIALHEKADESDLDTVLQGGTVCRTAAAKVFSDGLGYEPVRTKCRAGLIKLFQDPEKSVRAVTDHCFRKLTDEQLTEESDLIAAFVNSEAFADDAAQLCIALKDSNALLPNIVCNVAEKTIQLHRERHGEQGFDRFQGSGFYVAELIVRLYQQTLEPEIKSRCLDIIDDMLRVGVSSTENELEKAER